MSLTEQDLKSLRLLMREEIEPFRSEVNVRFREVDKGFEQLYAQNEKREQEYLLISEQLSRQEGQLSRHGQQLSEIAKELARHMQYFSDLDSRVSELEKKLA